MKHLRFFLILAFMIGILKGGFIYGGKVLAFTPAANTEVNENALSQAYSNYRVAKSKTQDVYKKLKKEPTPQPNNPDLLKAKKNQLSAMTMVMTQYLTILKSKLAKIDKDETIADQLQGEINKLNQHQGKIQNIKDEESLTKEAQSLKNAWSGAKNMSAKMSGRTLNNQLDNIIGQMDTNISGQMVAINQLKQYNKDTTKVEVLTTELKKNLDEAKREQGLAKSKILGISSKDNGQGVLMSAIVIMRKSQEILVIMAEDLIKLNTEISRLTGR